MAGKERLLRAGASLVVAAAALLVFGASSASGFGFVTAWDTEGSAVATDAAGNVYTTRSNLVQKFAPDGTLITQWGSEGAGPGQFANPGAVATDAAGDVYVADNGNGRIQKFSADGTYLSEFGNGTFAGTEGITVDPAGNTYLADTSSATVYKYDPSGALLGELGAGGGSDPGQFSFPRGIASDTAGNVYVADDGNNRVQKFAPDGTFLLQWGSEGTGDGQFSNGAEILDTDPFGNVYVVDADFTSVARIMKFTQDGVFLDKWGELGTADTEFYRPEGIAADDFGNVYIADFLGRVKKYGEVPPPVSGETVNLDLLKGKVTTKCKGEPTFTPLQETEQIDIGCQVDTTKGKVELVSATGKGAKTQSGDYSDGTFKVQQKQGKPEVTLTLTGKLDCPGGRPTAEKPGKGGGRSLFGSSNAATTTRGNNGAGTVRGKTAYELTDTCDGTTEVIVKKGTVKFEDFVSDRTVTVQAGDSYETEPRGN